MVAAFGAAGRLSSHERTIGGEKRIYLLQFIIFEIYNIMGATLEVSVL